jgi:lipoprotein LpqH
VAKHGISVGMAVAAVTVASLVGCSQNKSAPGSPPAGSAPAGPPKVLVDGQNQNVTGQVSCNQVSGNLSIGIGDPTNGVGAVVTNADPPAVQSVGLGSVNGVTLGYAAAAPNPGGSAQATKSGNTYTIKGTATGMDASNSQQVTKPFELDATCP